MKPTINPYEHFYCDDCGRLFNKTQRVHEDIDRCVECSAKAAALVLPKPSGVESILKEYAENAKKEEG